MMLGIPLGGWLPCEGAHLGRGVLVARSDNLLSGLGCHPPGGYGSSGKHPQVPCHDKNPRPIHPKPETLNPKPETLNPKP